MPTPTLVADSAYLCHQQHCPVQDLRPVQSFGHSSLPYDLAEWLAQGLEFGYSVGCDGELLPPRWVRRAN